VLTGADESGLLGRSREESRFPAFQLRGAAIARNSADGKYWFIFVIPHARLGYWFLAPQHWWMMAGGVFLCYLLAYYLTYPVRKLQHAVERFGRGDLSARAATRRHDELGELDAHSTAWRIASKRWWTPSAACCWISHMSCARRWRACG
jgi:two-component system sensor histidine kinase CpxA